MNKLKIVIVFILSTNFIFAQTGNVKKAKDYFEEFYQSKKIEKLESALKYIEDALNEEKALKSEYTFYYHGLILKAYNENISDDKKNQENILNAIGYFKKSLEINPKFDERDNILNNLKLLGYELYRNGITLFNESNHLKAFETYKSLISLYEYLKSQNSDFKYTNSNNETSDISFSDINNNYLVFAINAGKQKEAIEILKRDISSVPTATKYVQIVQLLGQSGDSMTKVTYLNEGTKKYPENIELLIFSINASLDQKDRIEAKNKLEKAILIDSKNSKLYQLLGAIYEEDKKIDLAKSMYKKGLESVPNNYDLIYSLGALDYNLGVELYKMSSKSDKSNSYKMLFESAKTYFEKCKSIQPNNPTIDKLLLKISEIK